MKRKLGAALFAATATLCIVDAAFADTMIERVQLATERFSDVGVALAEGYAPIPCASGADGGAMGIHYVNDAYLNKDQNTLDITKPEAVMYEPQKDGSLVLVGVEYLTFSGPAALEGHLLHFQGSPNSYGLDPFYELHVWAQRENPAGPFAEMNKDVTCEFAGDPDASVASGVLDGSAPAAVTAMPKKETRVSARTLARSPVN